MTAAARGLEADEPAPESTVRYNLTIEQLLTAKNIMADKNYSWKGSWNAGLVLSLLALAGAVFLIAAGFGG